MGLGLALKSLGHHPVLAVTRAYQPYVEAAGLECRPIRPEGDLSDRATVSRIMDPVRGPEFLIRQVMMPHLRDMYDDLADISRDADVVVSHPLTFAAPVLCEKRGLPWASSVLAPLSFFSREDPPQALPGPFAARLYHRWPGVMASMNAIGLGLTRRWTKPVDALRTSLGLPRGENPVGAGQFSPHLTLALFSAALAAPQSDWPPHTVVTGAIRYDAIHGTMGDDLLRFLDAGPPPVVFTLGSAAVDSRRAERFYQISAEAAAALGVRAVLLTGRDANRPRTIADSCFVADWAPHSELFPRAAAVVHQGGAGTLHTALAAGRPMLIVPFAHDQPDNAARTERLGVARVLYPHKYSPARVRSALEGLLSDSAVAARAGEVAVQVRAEDGAMTAARALASFRT